MQDTVCTETTVRHNTIFMQTKTIEKKLFCKFSYDFRIYRKDFVAVKIFNFYNSSHVTSFRIGSGRSVDVAEFDPRELQRDVRGARQLRHRNQQHARLVLQQNTACVRQRGFVKKVGLYKSVLFSVRYINRHLDMTQNKQILHLTRLTMVT